MKLFINACVRKESRTRRLAEERIAAGEPVRLCRETAALRDRGP